MLAAAMHLTDEVTVFCSSGKDLEYAERLISKFQLPISVGNPPGNIRKHEFFFPTIYEPIGYDGCDMMLDGYFQSHKYYDRAEVLRWFRCPAELEAEIFRDWGAVFSRFKTVSVHVRRGDYLALPERFPFVGKDYIKRAMARFKNQNTVFVFTSDDIEWCKRHFFGPNIFYSEGNDEYYDLFLASKCDHNILSNSTFSYWGGELNDNPDKIVIAPRRWYGPLLAKEAQAEKGSLLPAEWETVDCGWDDLPSCMLAYYRFFRCRWRDFIPSFGVSGK